MNVKRFLALTLAVTLSLSNTAWADVPVSGTETGSQEKRMPTATASDAEVDATASNAVFNLNRASEQHEITWEVDADEIYCGSPCEVRLSNGGQTAEEAGLRIQLPDGGSRRLAAVTIPAEGTEIITIPGEIFYVPGMYRITVVDREGYEKENVPFFTVIVKKRQAMTVTFHSQALNRIYSKNRTDTLVREAEASAFTAQADGKTLEGLRLTNITCVLEDSREAKEPGSYPVVKLSSDQCENITVTENEFAFFVIEKIPSKLTFKPLNLPIDGRELEVDIARISNIPAGQDITSVKVGQLLSWQQSLFTSLPPR